MKRPVIAAISTTAIAGNIGAADAADVGAPSYRAPPVVVPLVTTWTGFYAGANIGGAWTSNDALWSPLPSSAAFGAFPVAGSTGGSSVAGGQQAGYNWQYAPDWVVGIEGDWSWANASGNINQPWVANPGGGVISGSFTSMSSKLDWVSSLRARLGYLVAPDLMVYGTAGGALGQIDYAASSSNGLTYQTATAFSRTHGGWVAGAGVEWMVLPNWLMRGEYLYYSLNSAPSVVTSPGFAGGLPSGYSWSNTNASVARAALSYKF
jgi:outer membrane immunogenic protein